MIDLIMTGIVSQAIIRIFGDHFKLIEMMLPKMHKLIKLNENVLAFTPAIRLDLYEHVKS